MKKATLLSKYLFDTLKMEQVNKRLIQGQVSMLLELSCIYATQNQKNNGVSIPIKVS